MKNQKIKSGVYTYFEGESKYEKILANSVIDYNNFSIDDVVDKILKLPFNEQVHVIHYITSNIYVLNVNSMYNDHEISEKINKKIEKLLKKFSKHRQIIYCIVAGDNKRLKEFKSELDIKIVVQ